MSSKRKSEGIALLSIYGDEDDDDMDEEDMEEDQNPQTEDSSPTTDPSLPLNSPTPIHSDNTNTPPLSLPNYTPPLPQSQPSGRLTIVDYGHGHDDLALSPEQEEGELQATGRVTFGAHLQSPTGDFQEKTPAGTVHLFTPTTHATQSSEPYDAPQADAMNYAPNESEFVDMDESVDACVEEPKAIDPLEKFLSPLPKEKCPDELQDKIIKFLSLKRTTGRSFNAEVRKKKEYRNPDFLLHAVTSLDIDQIGSCFSKDVFDPHGYDKSDYYDEIEADMKREMERKEQERKKSPKIEYISGGTQPGIVVPGPKMNMPSGISSVPSGGLLPVPVTDAVSRDSRQNKKSKWDKVDGDRRNPLPTGGQDAALLSAANAGSGYTAFAQQRRREAEERRSSDRKLERRS